MSIGIWDVHNTELAFAVDNIYIAIEIGREEEVCVACSLQKTWELADCRQLSPTNFLVGVILVKKWIISFPSITFVDLRNYAIHKFHKLVSISADEKLLLVACN